MGKDGNQVVGNSNKNFALDAFGFSLGYFNGDYTAISQPSVIDNFLADKTGSDLQTGNANLYNGNISNMVTTIVPPTLTPSGLTYAPAPQGTAYKYDRLNRLKTSKAWQNLNTVDNVWATGSTYAGMYENNFSYDANGNITTQLRKDHLGVTIDSLTYNYAEVGGKKVQNRLYHVNDAFNYNTEDIDDMGTFNDNMETINDGITNNYKYDEIGNLIQDRQEEIDTIKWRVDGKIAEIKRGTGSTKQNLVFNYDPSGNRIAKHLYLYNSSNEYLWEKSTYYVRDAQANVMAVYNLTHSSSSGLSYKVAERNIYGSSKVGVNNTPVELVASLPTSNIYPHLLGDKQYQLENYLGNVLATVSDIKIPVDDGNGNIAYFMPNVLTANDFSAFGSLLENRNFNSEKYRVGWNKGSEKDDEITGITGSHINTYFREYDTRLARTWSLDPVFQPWQSSYSSMDNNPIYFNDPLGDKVKIRDRETRKSIRAARKEDSAFNQLFKDWKKEKNHTYIFEQAKGESNGLFAAARDVQQNGKHSTNTTVVQFDLMKDNQSQFVGTAQELSKINPLGTPDINAPDVNIGINSQQQVGIPPIPQPVPVNINVSAPFVNDQAVFANPNRANANIQRAAQAFINNPNATQIRISINTTANPNQAGVVFQNGQNFGQILQQRGNLVRQNLINQGVPPGAFGPNSIQINFNQNAVNTNINIR